MLLRQLKTQLLNNKPMDHYSIIGIVIALIGVLKGKDIWDYLKSLNETKQTNNQKILDIYSKQIEDCEEKNKNLERKTDLLTTRLQKHILKSKGKKDGKS